MVMTWSAEKDNLMRLRAYCFRELQKKKTEALVLKKDMDVLNEMIKHYSELVEKGD